MFASTWAQEAHGLIGFLPRREPLRPVDTRELARLRIPGDETRDEEAGADVEEERAPGHARFTLIRSWAPQVRILVTSARPTFRTRAPAFLPTGDVYSGPMISHSPVSPESRRRCEAPSARLVVRRETQARASSLAL